MTIVQRINNALTSYIGVVVAGYIVLGFFYWNSVVDMGDGLMHYFISEALFRQPELAFHHWGKPLFSLLMAGPAQFGLLGVVVLESVLVLLTALLMQRIAAIFKLSYTWAVPVLYILSKGVIYTLFGGLTEPVFAFAVVLSTWLVLTQRATWGIVLAGALWFIRPESVVATPAILLIYLLRGGQWKQLLWVLLIPALYTVLGVAFADKSWTWIINDQPYPTNKSVYGKGPWNHYLKNWYRVTSPAVGLLALVGGIRALLKKQWTIAVAIGVGIGIVAMHAVLWRFGLMGSAGLTRTLVTGLPFVVIGAAYALETLRLKPLMLVAVLLLLPSLAKESIGLMKYMSKPSVTEKAAYELAAQIHDEVAQADEVYIQASVLRYALGVSHFDPGQERLWALDRETPAADLTPGSIICFDNFTGHREGGHSLDKLQANPRLQSIGGSASYDSARVFHAFMVLPKTDPQ